MSGLVFARKISLVVSLIDESCECLLRFGLLYRGSEGSETCY